MTTTIQKVARAEEQKLEQKDSNILRRYSVRLENGESILYHQGESASIGEPQRVVNQNEVFNLLRRAVCKTRTLGHSG